MELGRFIKFARYMYMEERRQNSSNVSCTQVSWLVGCFGLTALSDSVSVYIGPSPRDEVKEERNDKREKKCPHLLQAQ